MKKINVLITIDTEHSVGGAFQDSSLKPVGNGKRVYGRVNGREYGIPMMMDIADRYGIPLTFFVEVLNHHYFGPAATSEVCRYILERGHDVQLHLHPTFINFSQEHPAAKRYSDRMSAYSLDAQTALVQEGVEVLTHYCGRPPVAFRAGNYAADINTLRALKANNLKIDSSYNLAFRKLSRMICPKEFNDVIRIEGIWELPVTTFRQALPGRAKFRPLDLNGVSFGEIRALLENARKGKGPDFVTCILHSFSFLKPGDIQYRNCRINAVVRRRFANLCRYLAAHPDSFSPLSLSNAHPALPLDPPPETPSFMSMPPHLTLGRLFQQLFA